MKKAFTLVEMLVAMAVSTIIIAATYASYDLVATQYKKNIDVAEMQAWSDYLDNLKDLVKRR